MFETATETKETSTWNKTLLYISGSESNQPKEDKLHQYQPHYSPDEAMETLKEREINLELSFPELSQLRDLSISDFFFSKILNNCIRGNWKNNENNHSLLLTFYEKKAVWYNIKAKE